MDTYHPTFREEPDLAKGLGQHATRGLTLREQAAQRESAREEVRRRLRGQRWGWFKAAIFNWVLAYAQCYLPLREDQRFHWHLILALQR